MLKHARGNYQTAHNARGSERESARAGPEEEGGGGGVWCGCEASCKRDGPQTHWNSAQPSSLITAAVSQAPTRRPPAPRCMRKVSRDRRPAGPASTATSTHPPPSSGRAAASAGVAPAATTGGGQAVPGGGRSSGKEVAKVPTKWSFFLRGVADWGREREREVEKKRKRKNGAPQRVTPPPRSCSPPPPPQPHPPPPFY
jgi:hypothetical protein